VSRFGTATIDRDGWKLDVVTARAESYVRSGALPTVVASTLEADLRRRDFTCNAIAIILSGRDRGAIVDPTGGREDIAARVIRVVHDGSFRDDPTRVIRAVRYEARLGFTIEAATVALIARDLGCLSAVSGTRLRQEIERTLREARFEIALARMHNMGVLQAIARGLSFGPAQMVAAERLRSIPLSPAVTPWAILCWNASQQEIEDICSRLALTRSQRDCVHAIPAARAAESTLETSVRPSEWVGLLTVFPVPTVIGLACATESAIVRERAIDFVQRLRRIRPALTGDDLTDLGIPQGPLVGEILNRLRAGRLDGELIGRADEESLVRAIISERVAAPTR
jgi:tRNA nucleotidyltransferase (CCA-adding enzyme)